MVPRMTLDVHVVDLMLQAESEEEAASIKEAEEKRAEQRSKAAKERSKVWCM